MALKPFRQRRERGAPRDDLVQQRIQRGGVLAARLEAGVVLELGQQRQRDLLAYIGHLQFPADQPQVLGCPGAAHEAGGEDDPPASTTWPWPAEKAIVTDVFGRTSTVTSHDGQIQLPVSLTPLFVAEPSTPPGQAVS